jgi:serine/threonine protein kinase
VQQLRPGDPERIGPFTLEGRLGAGGMGQVFFASSPGGRAVAVKVIHPELAGNPEFRALFGREVQAARSVSGFYTAPVVDADVDADIPWLATAYVAGPNLGDGVRQHGPFPVGAVRRLGAALAEALASIHRAGLVHRDLKPANVILAADGPRVVDFGIARAMEAGTLTGSRVLGTPHFMAPEQALGTAVSALTDVFSFGATLVFAATGAGPFGEGNPTAVLFRVVYQEPDLSAVPGPIVGLVARCLAKDPDARPSPAQILDELGPADRAAYRLLPEHVTDPVPPRPATVRTHPATAQVPPDPAAPQATRTMTRRIFAYRNRRAAADAAPGTGQRASPVRAAPSNAIAGASRRVEEILGRAAAILQREGEPDAAQILARVHAVKEERRWAQGTSLTLVVAPELDYEARQALPYIEPAVTVASRQVRGDDMCEVVIEPETPEFDPHWRDKLSG